MNEFVSFNFFTLILVSGLPLIVATVVSVVVTFLQTLFSIQEQTMVFGIRLLAVGLVCGLCGASGIRLLQACLISSLSLIADSSHPSLIVQ